MRAATVAAGTRPTGLDHPRAPRGPGDLLYGLAVYLFTLGENDDFLITSLVMGVGAGTTVVSLGVATVGTVITASAIEWTWRATVDDLLK